MKKLSIVLLCIFALIIVANETSARSSYLERWEAIYPNSLSNNSSCTLCHGTRNSNLNGYGLEIKIENDQIRNIDLAIQNVEEIDSDIDLAGLLNIEEINAGAQPGWTDGPNNSIYNMDGSTYLKDQNAPKDIQGILDPIAENQPPVTKANGPYSGNVYDPISFSSLGSSDADGSIATYLWSFGDGNTSTQANPTHSYSAADTYSVILTITDDKGAASSDTTTALISVPSAKDPDIDLSSSSLNFSQVEIGSAQIRTIEVKNLGTETLNVTGIKLCEGTSTEYTWSPAIFTLDPSAGQTLTVMYTPLDENSDEGCLIIDSNDPDENSILLDLTGSGFVPQPEVFDVDIARFQVTKRVSLKRVKPINIKLVAKNNSTIADFVNAIITGKQSGTEIYKKTVTISVRSGVQTTISLPKYIPLDIGNIDWTIEIDDGDLDVDNATATTKVVP